MSATDRSGLGFSRANTDESASARDPRGKTQAKVHAFRFHLFGSARRVNSCGMSSRVETMIVRNMYVSVRTASGRGPYHYCGINTLRRNSENTCRNCGNPTPLISACFRIAVINKDLDLFQNGPIVANHVPPAQLQM
jgi:hypothetical protein